ncbi:MAG: type II toxin-antitoxin system RelE/ParE family toxin [Pirellulaceae bacterium]|nr:type II toxin-antitoxin system RelE/ParE family toxin [Pirellulaceae bacterium]
MPSVFFSPEAENDLVGIADYIARDKPEAARRWIQKIRETCQTLAGQPGLGEIRADFGVAGCRAFSVGNYLIFFRPMQVGIEVARVLHGSRDLRDL